MPLARPIETSQEVVDGKPGPEGNRSSPAAGRPGRGVGQAVLVVHGNDELEGLKQVVGDPGQYSLLTQSFGYQLEPEMGQVADSPMKKFGGTPGGTRSPICLLDQGNPETPGSEVEGDTTADHPAPDDHDIEGGGFP
jgi:hypothetical protein